MLKVLEGLHPLAAQQIMGLKAKCGAGGEWGNPLVVEATDDEGLEPIRD